MSTSTVDIAGSSTAEPEPAPTPTGLSQGSLALGRLALAIAILALWEGLSRALGMGFWIGSPTGIGSQLADWVSEGTIWRHTWITLSEAFFGFILGALVGSLLGFALGWWRSAGQLVEPFVIAFYTMPRIALAPLFVLWFGIGISSKVVMAATLVFFFVFFTTFQGTKSVDKELVDIAQVMGGDSRQLLWKIGIPNAAIWVFSGFRMALPFALIGAVVGEFIAAREGLGYLIKNGAVFLNTNAVFAGLFVLMIISNFAYKALAKLERRVLKWQ